MTPEQKIQMSQNKVKNNPGAVTYDDIKELLTPIIHAYAKERNEGERFGDFVIRAGYVKATTAGNNFHANIEQV